MERLPVLILAVMFVGGSSIRLHTANKLNTQTCPEKVHEQIAKMTKLVNGNSCTGKESRRVCEPSAFSEYFGEKDAALVANYLKRAQTNMTKTKPTPWLTAGDFAFMGNEYLDFFIYSLFFKDRAEKGTYVEMGGSNGVHASNTYFFDHALGWKGGLIEPTPCGVCQIPFNRPNSIGVHAAVCMKSSTFDATYMMGKGFCGKSQMSGCNSFSNPKKVQCEPMTNLFSQINEGMSKSGDSLAHIDFFSLDVEKNWKAAFDTIDFEKTPINVFLLECNPRKQTEPCESRLKAKGYEFTWVSKDDILAWKPEARPEVCAQ